MIWTSFVIINDRNVPKYLVVFNMSTIQFNHLDIHAGIVKSNATMINYHDLATIIFFEFDENIQDYVALWTCDVWMCHPNS